MCMCACLCVWSVPYVLKFCGVYISWIHHFCRFHILKFADNGGNGGEIFEDMQGCIHSVPFAVYAWRSVHSDVL